MTKDKIISELFLSKEFNDCIRKMEPKHLQDDLRSEVMLVLCEKPAFVIEALHEKGELRFYAVRIILNMIRSNTSPFYKKFRAESLNQYCISGEDIQHSKYPGATDGEFEFNMQKWNIQKNALLDDGQIKEVNIQDRLTEEKKNELRMMEVFNQMPNRYYDMNLLLEYLELGSLRAITKEIGIPHNSAHDTIKKAIKKIDEAVEFRMLKKQPYEPAELIEYITRADRYEAIEKLYGVLDYFQREYPAEIISEVKRRAKEREQRFIDQEQIQNRA